MIFEFDCQKTTRIEFKCGGAKHQFGGLDQDSRMIQIKRARLSDHPAKHGNKKNVLNKLNQRITQCNIQRQTNNKIRRIFAFN